MKKEEFIKKHGEAGYKKYLQQKRDEYRKHPEKAIKKSQLWKRNNPEKVKANESKDGEKGKMLYLSNSSEEGFVWKLRLEVCENTKIFCGHFALYGEDVKRKHKIRAKDRQFFHKRLGGLYLNKYEIDHDWNNGGRVTLRTPKEHRNSHFGKSNQVDWIEKEEWLQEAK